MRMRLALGGLAAALALSAAPAAEAAPAPSISCHPLVNVVCVVVCTVSRPLCVT